MNQNTTQAKQTLLRKKKLRMLFNASNGTNLFAALCNTTFLITAAAVIWQYNSVHVYTGPLPVEKQNSYAVSRK